MRRVLTAALLAGLLVSCSGKTAPGTAGVDCVKVAVLAASSLRQYFGSPDGNPCGDDWQLSFGSSTALVAQVREGVPADVFLAAGNSAVEQLHRDGLTVGEPTVIGTVGATLIVNARIPAGLSLQTLPARVKDGLVFGLCVASAPCGATADRVLANAAAVWGDSYSRKSLVSTEMQSADELVAAVASGELDAALIYENYCFVPPGESSTFRCADIPDEAGGRAVDVRTPYVAVRLRSGAAADSFMDYVTGKEFAARLAERSVTVP